MDTDYINIIPYLLVGNQESPHVQEPECSISLRRDFLMRLRNSVAHVMRFKKRLGSKNYGLIITSANLRNGRNFLTLLQSAPYPIHPYLRCPI